MALNPSLIGRGDAAANAFAAYDTITKLQEQDKRNALADQQRNAPAPAAPEPTENDVLNYVKANAVRLDLNNSKQAADALVQQFGKVAIPFAESLANADQSTIDRIHSWAGVKPSTAPLIEARVGTEEARQAELSRRNLPKPAQQVEPQAAPQSGAVPGQVPAPIVAKPGKAPTQDQTNAATYGARAETSDKILSQIGDQYSPMGVSAGNTFGVAANWALSPATQQAAQAQRDFITAVLRKESGATISDSEFDNARQQYFPQPGDSDAVKLQKAQNRQIAIQGLKNAAGSAAFSPNTNPNVMGKQPTPQEKAREILRQRGKI